MRVLALLQKLLGGKTQSRMDHPRGDLGQGFQDEPALMETGVGDDEVGLIPDQVSIEQQIHVQLAGAARQTVFPTERPLEIPAIREQLTGCEGSRRFHRQVDEPGLLRDADGFGPVPRGAA
jgi:hypothetical protein